MTKGLLINDIELAHAPMSAYHFSLLIKDKKFHNNLLDSHLYIITQRKAIYFDNIYISENFELSFDIRQEDNEKIIYCSLPIFQKCINPDRQKIIELRIHNRKNTVENKTKFPFNGTQAFSIQERDILTGETNIIFWFSPDKLFQKHWKNEITAKFSGDYKKMLEFKVHYVGKSTEQNICKRLSSHSTFQEILTKEESLKYGDIPSNEIMILLMRIKDNNTIVSWGNDSTAEEMSDYINNYSLPSDKTISLDAEKALIKHLQPHYNKILYDSFPSKNDLINTDYHSVILYVLNDPISLMYEKGIIKGGNSFLDERDYISVEREKNNYA